MTKFDKPFFGIRLNNILTLPHDWMVTATCNLMVNGDFENNRDNRKATFSMEATVYKWFMKRALQLSASVTDIFDSTDTNSTLYTGYSTSTQRTFCDTRGVNVTARYFFNIPQNRHRGYRGSGAGESEKRRLGHE